MYVCIYVSCVCVVRMYVCMYARTYVRTYVRTYLCIHVYMCICIHVYRCIHVYMYICTYVYMYIHINVHTYIYTHIHTFTCIHFFLYLDRDEAPCLSFQSRHTLIPSGCPQCFQAHPHLFFFVKLFLADREGLHGYIHT